MGNMCEKALSIIRIINWYWYATKRNGICHATHRYVKTNNKYTTGYDKNQRIIVSNLVRWKQVIQMDTGSEITFRQFWMTKKIYQTYSDNSDKGYIFEVDAKHPKQ